MFFHRLWADEKHKNIKIYIFNSEMGILIWWKWGLGFLHLSE